MKKACMVIVALGMLAGMGLARSAVAGTAASADVNITADNSYSIGFGTFAGPTALVGNITNTVAGDIGSCATGPEMYTVNVNPGEKYFYIVAWSDDGVTSGVLAQVFNTVTTFYTGIGQWEVYATGIDKDNAGPPPTLAEVQAQVALANGPGGPAGTSVRFVPAGNVGPMGQLVNGELNDAVANGGCGSGNVFGQVCTSGAAGINAAARWMWYNPDPTTIADPFCADGTARREYLIFRISTATTVKTEAPAMGVWGLLGLVLLLGGAGYVMLRKTGMGQAA